MKNDSDNLAERIVELENRLAFQEQTLEQLHEALYRQQRQLDELSGTISRLQGRLREILPGQEGAGQP